MIKISGFPTKATLNGVVWRVKYVDDMRDVDVDGKDRMFGQICYELNEIRVFRGKRSKSDIDHTLIHEFLHAFLRYHGGDDPYLKAKDEEKFINALTAFLQTVSLSGSN